MYNVCDSLVDKSGISRVLSNLTSLTHLDISKGVVDSEVEERSEEYLDKEVLVTVSKLPNLVHFDMSGLNFFFVLIYLKKKSFFNKMDSFS